MNGAPLIAQGFYSYQIGGSERVGADLAFEYRRRGYQVLCFALYDSSGPIRDELEHAGIRCVDLDYTKRKNFARRATFQVEVFNMLRRERVARLHLHHTTSLILCGLAAKAARIPNVLMTEHGLHQFYDWPRYRRQARVYCKLAPNISVVDPVQVEYFNRELGVPARKLHYIPNGVRMASRDPGSVRAARNILQVPDEAFALCFAGRLNPVKDLETLLRATADVAEPARSKLRVYIIGDGPERPKLEELRHTLGLTGHVTLVGPRQDVRELLLGADGFIMTSVTEGLPMALLEAMSAGVPCIATRVGGIPDLFSDGCGILVTPKDVAGVAAAITSLVEDASLRNRLIDLGLARIRAVHSLDATAERYLELLGLPPVWRGQR